LASFIEPGQFSFGLEPEVILNTPTGAGFNFKPRYGVNDLLDVQASIGTGTGARKLRLGFVADFEWFPDFESQPGIATPFFIDYVRYEGRAQILFGAKPMVYKTFEGEKTQFTPFFALPVGWSVYESNMQGFMQVALGCVFKIPEIDKWRFTFESGFNISHSYSYLSGGATYYY
jgi:hypothetical protein